MTTPAATTRDLLDVLHDVHTEHACLDPLYVFDELGGHPIIRCTSCRSIVWREE